MKSKYITIIERNPENVYEVREGSGTTLENLENLWLYTFRPQQWEGHSPEDSFKGKFERRFRKGNINPLTDFHGSIEEMGKEKFIQMVYGFAELIIQERLKQKPRLQRLPIIKYHELEKI